MTWPLASSFVLVAVLVAGFAWYERSRPPAKVVALVATLAALAAISRIAFAPLPNVKPTTDIVLISGLVLGGAPGFCVGALAALTSNLFFGQGPWTPWQMAAWGGVGVAGALLGRLTGRIPGRLALAGACAVAGLAFGAVMNLFTFSLLGDHSPAAFAAVSARALPFDLAHATGNLVFALAFGPALARALARYRERLEVRWRPAAAPAGATSALALVVVAAALAASPATASAATPAAYLRGAQNADGGFGPAPGARSTQLHSAWAALGLAAAGQNPVYVRRAGGRSVIDYIRTGAAQLNDTGELERTILVLGAAGVSPRNFAGRDLVAALGRRRGPSGAYSGQVTLTAFAIMALRAAGHPASSLGASTRWLASQQNPDGGFNFGGRGGASGVDDTAAALEGLAAGGAGRSRAAIRAVLFLARQQNRDGGFPLVPGQASNAQSTAFAVQGLLAAGRNPDTLHRLGARSPLAYLRSLTTASGMVRYSRSSSQTPVWVTGQALAALARRPFPLRRLSRRAGGASATAAAGGAGRAGSGAKSGGTSASVPAAGSPRRLIPVAAAAGIAAGWLMAPVR